MYCDWDSFIRLLPMWMRDDVNRLGKQDLMELRLRVGVGPELICKSKSISLSRIVCADDLKFCINTASGYAPWAAKTIANGYITATGGHRIGICGDAIISEGTMVGIRSATMLCLRVARDFPGIAEKVPMAGKSVLIIGRPGSGKTTFLRDLIRNYSRIGIGSIGVVDERGELFPFRQNAGCIAYGDRTDVISGCSKEHGIELLLRCMGPTTIAVDEITSRSDCKALMHAAWCGVNLFATAHAGCPTDLTSRPVYKPLIDSRIFDVLVIISPDKTWKMERMNL